MSNVKGSDLRIGQRVTVKIATKDALDAVVIGSVGGVQIWTGTTLAVQIVGLDSWIVLNDNVEVSVL